MELRQLERFVAVAEEMSFTRAANRLNIVQSALTTSIQDLERELRATLFLRSTRRVEGLTDAGKAFLVEARRTLAAARSAREVVTAVEGLLTGTLTIGIVQHFVIPQVELLSTLGRFHAQHPGVEIRLVQHGSPFLMDGVRECQLDLAVLGHVGRVPEGVTTTLLVRDPLLLAFPPTHPLARRREIPLSSLGDEDFVEYRPGMTLRKISDLAFSAAGIHRKTACEVNSLPTALELVAQGLGIALVPQVATSYPANVRYVRPRPPVPTWDVVIAHLGAQPMNPAARAFLKALTGKSGKTSRH